MAPFVPFLAEAIWQNLAVAAFGQRTLESVHLADYPALRPERPSTKRCRSGWE